MLGKDANSFTESGIRQANRIFTGPRVDEIPDHGGTLAELKTLQRPFCCSFKDMAARCLLCLPPFCLPSSTAPVRPEEPRAKRGQSRAGADPGQRADPGRRSRRAGSIAVLTFHHFT